MSPQSLYWLWPTWGIVGCSLIASMQIFKPPDVLHMCQDTPVKIGRPRTLISHRDVTDYSLPPNPQPISVFLFRFGLFDAVFLWKRLLFSPWSLETLIWLICDDSFPSSWCVTVLHPHWSAFSLLLYCDFIIMEPQQCISIRIHHQQRSLWTTRLVH